MGTAGTSEQAYEEARSLYAEGRYSEALPLLEQLVESDPGDVVLWRALAASAFNLEDYARAEHAYRRVIALDPDPPDAAELLAVAVEQQGRPEEAAELRAAAKPRRAEPAGADPSELPEAELPATGTAHYVQPRYEGQSIVLGFRVLPQDGSRPFEVEMRGVRLSGSVNEGDLVTVDGRRRRGIVRSHTLHNRTTGATVKLRSFTPVRLLVGLAVAFVMTAIIAVAAAGVFGVEAGPLGDLERRLTGEDDFEREARQNCERNFSAEQCRRLVP